MSPSDYEMIEQGYDPPTSPFAAKDAEIARLTKELRICETEKKAEDAVWSDECDRRGDEIARLREIIARMEETTKVAQRLLAAKIMDTTEKLRVADVTIDAFPPPRAVKVDVSKEWCIAAAEQEGDLSIGAGAPSPPSDENLPTGGFWVGEQRQ